ncbi:MAG: hypothetical protein U5M50_10710 [Sphingobium sp.]|nr:hypothetical protein [Sphingobium sp.]
MLRNYLKSINSRGCGSLLTNQSFLDKNGKNIPNFELKNYPYKTIQIGNIDFSLRLTFELSDSILDITSKKISENPYNNINAAIAAIKQDILTQKQFYPAYYFFHSKHI